MIDNSGLLVDLLLKLLLPVILGGIICYVVDNRKNKQKKKQEVLNASKVDSLMKDSANKQKAIIEFDFVEKENFSLGETRFFADTVDLPKDFEQPKDMFFVGQLNFDLLSEYDETGILPKEGQLYIYCNDFAQEKDGHIPCKLYYSATKDLISRKSKLESDRLACPRKNCSIAKIEKSVEKFNDQYHWDDRNKTVEFDYFFHSSISKIFGYYTDCQKDEKEILDVSSKYIILLQLGDNILADGVMTFLIKKEDLKNKNFENAVLTYSQS